MTRTILAMLLLVGCTPTVVSDYCVNARPITYSASQDSQETIRQVRESNAVFQALCGG